MTSLCLLSGLAAQSGDNSHVFSNGHEGGLEGVGAGGGSIPGVDGVGLWMRGETISGGSRVDLDGDGTKDGFGYRSTGFSATACVDGPQIPGLRVRYPAITLVEFDGGNSNQPIVFPLANCAGGSSAPGGLIPSVVSGSVPYGSPVGSPSAFIFGTLPSGSPITRDVGLMLPNEGLLPSGQGATATVLLALSSVSLPIASTGFCWTMAFAWAPSALVSDQDIDGWWWWFHNSEDGNQHWGMSTDEMNPWQSQTVATEGGYSQSAIRHFTANVGLDFTMRSANPVTQEALGGYGLTQSGPYYGNSTLSPGSPSGIDLGSHVALSVTGTGGVLNPTSGLGNQDPGATVGGTATIAFATWNNRSYTTTPGPRLTWIQPDFDKALGIDPALSTSVTVYGGQARSPLNIQSSFATVYPMPLTQDLFFLFQHSTTQPGDWGASTSFPLTTIFPPSVIPFCSGMPLGIEFGSNGIGPFTWNPDINEVSTQNGVGLIL